MTATTQPTNAQPSGTATPQASRDAGHAGADEAGQPRRGPQPPRVRRRR
ncbi:hypothetical protein [Streptomyces sp. NPDC002611]